MMKLVAVLAAYVPLALLRGWVIALLWGWYVADYFDLSPLTVVEAVGLGVLASVFLSRPPTEEEKERGVAEDILYAAMFPLLALLFGWLWSFVR
jgi:hypothetical protein